MPANTISGTFSNQLVTEYGTKIKVITLDNPKIEVLELPDVIEAKIACQTYGAILVPDTEATYYITVKDNNDGKIYRCASSALDELDVGDDVIFSEVIE